MKRQKRDRLERAQSQGYKAGLNGRSMEAVPINKWMQSHIGLAVGVTREMINNQDSSSSRERN